MVDNNYTKNISRKMMKTLTDCFQTAFSAAFTSAFGDNWFEKFKEAARAQAEESKYPEIAMQAQSVEGFDFQAIMKTIKFMPEYRKALLKYYKLSNKESVIKDIVNELIVYRNMGAAHESNADLPNFVLSDVQAIERMRTLAGYFDAVNSDEGVNYKKEIESLYYEHSREINKEFYPFEEMFNINEYNTDKLTSTAMSLKMPVETVNGRRGFYSSNPERDKEIILNVLTSGNNQENSLAPRKKISARVKRIIAAVCAAVIIVTGSVCYFYNSGKVETTEKQSETHSEESTEEVTSADTSFDLESYKNHFDSYEDLKKFIASKIKEDTESLERWGDANYENQAITNLGRLLSPDKTYRYLYHIVECPLCKKNTIAVNYVNSVLGSNSQFECRTCGLKVDATVYYDAENAGICKWKMACTGNCGGEYFDITKKDLKNGFAKCPNCSKTNDIQVDSDNPLFLSISVGVIPSNLPMLLIPSGEELGLYDVYYSDLINEDDDPYLYYGLSSSNCSVIDTDTFKPAGYCKEEKEYKYKERTYEYDSDERYLDNDEDLHVCPDCNTSKFEIEQLDDIDIYSSILYNQSKGSVEIVAQELYYATYLGSRDEYINGRFEETGYTAYKNCVFIYPDDYPSAFSVFNTENDIWKNESSFVAAVKKNSLTQYDLKNYKLNYALSQGGYSNLASFETTLCAIERNEGYLPQFTGIMCSGYLLSAKKDLSLRFFKNNGSNEEWPYGKQYNVKLDISVENGTTLKETTKSYTVPLKGIVSKNSSSSETVKLDNINWKKDFPDVPIDDILSGKAMDEWNIEVSVTQIQ